MDTSGFLVDRVRKVDIWKQDYYMYIWEREKAKPVLQLVLR